MWVESTYHDNEEVLDDECVYIERVLVRVRPESVSNDFHDLVEISIFHQDRCTSRFIMIANP